MKYFATGADLAKEIGCSVETIIEEHRQHKEAADKQEKDPEGGPYPAYPNGKSWDKPSGETGVGKKFFHNVLAPEKFATEPFNVAFVTPVIHYCMGGVRINEDSEVVREKPLDATWTKICGKKDIIPGLYAGGEVAGGVHGNNRLGGSSLLDCVVFGRVAGRACAKFMQGSDGKYRCFPVSAEDKPYATC